ncbi:MAG: OmpA family protein [Betaproteobacteria bacterium]|nr:OmpA family protein [Betaproteobacteria bacterium]
MKPRVAFSILTMALAAGGLAGCANMTETQRGTATGAGVGAATGAVIGAVSGGNRGARAATGAAVGGAIGAGAGYIWSQRMQQQRAAMEQATKGTGVAVTQTPDNQLKLEIPSDISFATGRSDIQPNLAPILDRFAASLRDHQATTVNIVGHTDSTGTDAINDPLSVNRAASTRDYLTARGIAGNRVTVSGMGSRQPIAENTTEQGRAKNRRVEIYVGEVAPVASTVPAPASAPSAKPY